MDNQKNIELQFNVYRFQPIADLAPSPDSWWTQAIGTGPSEPIKQIIVVRGLWAGIRGRVDQGRGVLVGDELIPTSSPHNAGIRTLEACIEAPVTCWAAYHPIREGGSPAD